MKAKVWTVTAADGPHTVAVEHDRWLFRRTIVVDGRRTKTQVVGKRFGDVVTETFPVGAATAEITIEPRGFSQWHHALKVGAEEIVPRLPKEPMPQWIWLPILGCYAPFALMLAQQAPPTAAALAGLMGGGGSVACLSFARDSLTPMATRQRRCGAAMLFVWAVLALPAVAMAGLFALLNRSG